jgi:hypothetical protein
VTEQHFDEQAYDDARTALGDVNTENLPKVAELADTPAKAKAVQDEIAERGRRG